MKRRFKQACVSAVCALALCAPMESAWASGLTDALAAAYSSNPTLLAERARLRATDEGVNQAKSGWRPTVTFTGEYGFGESRQEFARFFGAQQSFVNLTYTRDIQGTLQGSQPLFRGFQTINSTRAAEARVRAGRGSLWNVEQQVLLDTVTAYMDVIRDAATIELNKNNVQVLKRQLEASEDRFRVGEITRTDVAQSEARLSLAQSNLSRSQATLSESRSRYQAVVGQAPGTLDPSPPLPDLPLNLEEAISVSLENNPGLLTATQNAAAAKHDVASAKGGLLPTIDAIASATTNETLNRLDEQSANYSVTGRMTVPIYQAGAQYSQIRQAKQTYSQQRILVAQQRRDVVRVATNAYENLVASRATIVSDRQQVRANEIAFEGVQQEAQVGSRTTLDVLDAEQELLDARVALVRSERDEYVAAFQLLSAVGRLTAQDLGLPVELYDPATNYRSVRNKLFGYGISTD